MNRHTLLLFSCLAFALCTNAQDTTTKTTPTLEVAGVKITGSADVYYRYNFNNPKTAPFNSYTSFTGSQNSFELGMASLQASHSFGKASAFVDLGFGRRAEEFNYPDGSTSEGKNGFVTLAAVKQLNVSYAIADKFKLTMGKWATHIGYELVDAYLNRNYSMDYMFSFGPFSHTGLKADIGLGAKSALMVGVANSTDNATTTLSRKYAIAQYSTATKDDKFKMYLNYQGTYGGSLDLTQLDLVLNVAVSDQFGIGYNGTVQSRKVDGGDNHAWWGSALYFNYDPVSTFGITLRGEYFDDKKGVLNAPFGSTSIFDLTLSPNFKVGNLTIIPELRLDAAKDNVFEKNNGDGTKSTVTGILAATYHF